MIGLPRPLDVQAVGRIYARLSERAGLSPFSGHSARVGATQDMTRAGYSLAAKKTPVGSSKTAQ